MPDIRPQLEKNIAPEIVHALDTLGGIAASRGEGLYLVGGIVRDLLLGTTGREPDIDLIVEGDAPALAHAAAGKTGAQCEIHRAFATATIILPIGEGFRIDFAGARTETYKRPGALPKVSPAKNVWEDLARRDFTVNAMAAPLDPERRGELIDPHGGLDDLDSRLLRVIHDLSFMDDPTRILRGLRFKARLSFEFENRTASLAGAAIDDCCFHTLSGARIRKELRASLEEPARAAIINELSRMDIDGALVPGLCFHTRLIEPEDRIAASAAALSASPEPFEFEPWTAYLLASAWGADGETLEALARRISLSRREAAPLLNRLAWRQDERARLEDPETTAAEFDDIAATAEPELLILLHATDEEGIAAKRIEDMIMSADRVRLEISGVDLLGMGHEPSPVFGKVLKEVRRSKIEGRVKNRRQELALARKLLDAWD